MPRIIVSIRKERVLKGESAFFFNNVQRKLERYFLVRAGTPQHISVIEKNKRAPSFDSLAKLAEELGVTTDYLITGKENVISDIIPVIKADKTLDLEVKNALVRLVQALYEAKVRNY